MRHLRQSQGPPPTLRSLRKSFNCVQLARFPDFRPKPEERISGVGQCGERSALLDRANF